jgi:protein-disulfide isomerase
MSQFRGALLLCISAFFVAKVPAQNVGTPKPREPVATIDNQPIYEEDLLPSVQGQLQPLRNQEYEIKRKALDSLIEQKLLEAVAKKKGLTTDQLLAQEVDAKVPNPSDAEIEGYYYGLKITRPLNDAKAQLKESLRQAKAQQLRQDYIKNLRADANVAVLLSPPKVSVAYDPARVRGNPEAPVMIVEFSDYQCPYCQRVEPTVKELLAKYGDKVSLAYRDLPLRQIHPQAQIAAEASRCAEEQGKFWEYHDQLFAAPALDRDSLVQYARDLKLDDKQFDSCLTSGKYKADIDKDLREGMQAGVNGTPGFFINGVTLSGAQPKDAFEHVIDDELARKNKPAPTAAVRISRVN